MTWSRHSRRIDPIRRSQYGFCHGEPGAVATSLMPIDPSASLLEGEKVLDPLLVPLGREVPSDLPSRHRAPIHPEALCELSL